MAPWYKQFWPWFLIALPLTSVIVGFAFLAVAVHDPDDMVVDDYYRQGLAINRAIDRERKAEQLGLHGELSYDPKTGLARVRLSGIDIRKVELRLVHPARARFDLKEELHQDMSGGLSGAIGFPRAADWRVLVEPTDGTWRLSGRLLLPEQPHAELQPG